MKRLYSDYLEDMLDAMDAATEFTTGMSEEQFSEDKRTIYATVRALEIVGEAAKRIPQEIRERWPGISWRQMSGPFVPTPSGCPAP